MFTFDLTQQESHSASNFSVCVAEASASVNNETR